MLHVAMYSAHVHLAMCAVLYGLPTSKVVSVAWSARLETELSGSVPSVHVHSERAKGFTDDYHTCSWGTALQCFTHTARPAAAAGHCDTESNKLLWIFVQTLVRLNYKNRAVDSSRPASHHHASTNVGPISVGPTRITKPQAVQ